MNVNKEDPRLTAFALGELDGDERDAIEKAVEADPELEEWVKEVGVAANLAGLALQQDDAPGLTEEQREAVLDASAHLAKRHGGDKSRRSVWRVARVRAIAALLAVALGAYAVWLTIGNSVAPTRDMAWKADQAEELHEWRTLGLKDTSKLDRAEPKTVDELHGVDPERPDKVYELSHRTGGAQLKVETAPGKPDGRPAIKTKGDVVGDAEQNAQVHDLVRAYDGLPQQLSPGQGAADADQLQTPAPSAPATEAGVPRPSNLQNVQVGGEIRVRKRYYQEQNIDPATLEPVGTKTSAAPTLAKKEGEAEPIIVEQRTRLNVKADFRDQLAAALPQGSDDKAIRLWADPSSESQPSNGTYQYGIAGDVVPESTALYSMLDRANIPTQQSQQREVNVVITDNGGKPIGLSGGGGFGGGGGGYGGGGYGGGPSGSGGFGGGGGATPNQNGSWDYFGDISGNGGFNPPQPERFYLSRNEDNNFATKLNYTRFAGRAPGTESYAPIPQKPLTDVSQEPLSTFSVDVDTASYANVRRFLTQGHLPPPDAVRVEEMINYFDYEYAPPRGENPISVDVEIAQCVWETQHRLARIALKAREVPMDDRGPANLVFLIDVSGSMKDSNKLPLLKESMKALTRRLQPHDRVAIVTYRDAASIALSPTTVGDKGTVEAAINSLHADGSTNGAGGLDLAYSVASQNVITGGINRVILATDGDFNVGETDNKKLVNLVRTSAATGVFLTVLGFGEGNLKDDRLEALADKGDGAYHYIDNYNEATRVLCAQVDSTLATVAKDVKVQIEFNPQHVSAYRLIGYENRALAAADFNNDRKDAGEMGSGETVTALYELVPPGVSTTPGRGVDDLKYQSNPAPPAPPSDEINPETMTVKVRYKEPEGDASRKFEVPVVDRDEGYDQSSRDYRWATAVAGFGMLLRHSCGPNPTWVDNDGRIVSEVGAGEPNVLGTLSLDQVRDIAESAKGSDPDGRRAEFISLVVAAQTLTKQ